MVSYPNRPGSKNPSRPSLPGMGNGRDKINNGKINVGDRKVNVGDRKVNIGDRKNTINIGEVNVGGRNKGLSRPSNLIGNNNKRDWNNNNNKRWNNNKIWGNNNNVNIKINNNFRGNNNFSYRPNYWGARPWWGASSYHSWHHGHWNHGWNSHHYHRHWYYNDNDFAKGFMWGIAVWSLGNMVYDMGYNNYRNPYPAPPVQNTYITYEQPISVAAAQNPPAESSSKEVLETSLTSTEEAAPDPNETKSNAAFELSRTAFKANDYVSALKHVDEALAFTPSDVTLHEYRSLVYFALGKYAEAAGVLNPVLASGPGWGWDTMSAFYDVTATYDKQLRTLEDYSKASSDRADVFFLLGYHYMVTDHMEESNAQFVKAAELQPADTISAQLRDLTSDSIATEDGEVEPSVKPDPVPLEKLVGTWTSETSGGKISFTMVEGGDYTWTFGENELKGTYGLNDQGLLVLTSDDSQMVSVIDMKDDTQMHFNLVGAPDGDPGLDFKKS